MRHQQICSVSRQKKCKQLYLRWYLFPNVFLLAVILYSVPALKSPGWSSPCVSRPLLSFSGSVSPCLHVSGSVSRSRRERAPCVFPRVFHLGLSSRTSIYQLLFTFGTILTFPPCVLSFSLAPTTFEFMFQPVFLTMFLLTKIQHHCHPHVGHTKVRTNVWNSMVSADWFYHWTLEWHLVGLTPCLSLFKLVLPFYSPCSVFNLQNVGHSKFPGPSDGSPLVEHTIGQTFLPTFPPPE